MYTLRSGTCWNNPPPSLSYPHPPLLVSDGRRLPSYILPGRLQCFFSLSLFIALSLSPLYAFNFLHLSRSHSTLSLSSQFCYANEISDDVGALLLGWGEKLTFWLSIAAHLVSGLAREQGVSSSSLSLSLGFSLIDSRHIPQSFTVPLVSTWWFSH